MRTIYYILLIALLCQGCKTSSSVSRDHHVGVKTTSYQGQSEFENKRGLTTELMQQILQDRSLKFTVYDTSKPLDSITKQYPTIMVGEYSNKDIINSNNKEQEQEDTSLANKEELKQKEENTSDSEKSIEKNKKTKVEQSTSLLWAIVALLVVGLFIYKRIKK